MDGYESASKIGGSGDATSVQKKFCHVCQKNNIHRWAINEEFWNRGDRVICGTRNEILTRSHCALCRLLLKLVPADITAEVELTYSLNQLYVHQLQSILGFIKVGPVQDQHQASIDSSVDDLQRAPKLNPALIRNWLHTCETSHEHPVPGSSARYQKPIDIILVDTHENRLVKSSTDNRFLALSYVWGPIPIFQMTALNRSALEKPGGLVLYRAKLPRIIRDAIDLVVALQERFLWVDSLCIEQDNAAQKHGQIAQMDIIFSQALVTLIALSANDANSCLPGVHPNTMLPPSGSEPFSAGGRLFFDPADPLGRAIEPMGARIHVPYGVYGSRAWTFQERLLSKRCLFFTYHYYYYICSNMAEIADGLGNWGTIARTYSVYNSLPSKIAGHLPASNEIHLKHIAWSSAFPEYAFLILVYTRKKLSYPSDILNAFSGILSLFQHRLGGEMISGLPERVLDLALLWIHEYGAPQLRNREFPSWSWAGWVGTSSYSSGPLFPNHTHGYGGAVFLNIVNLLPAPIRPQIEGLQVTYQTPKRDVQRDLREIEQSDDVMPYSLSDNPAVRRGQDILHFWAQTVESHHFKLSRHLSPPLQIWNAEGIHCGILFDHPGLDYNYVSGTSEFVLLSRTKRPTETNTRGIEIVNGMGQYETIFDHRKFEQRPWCLMNVMLVQWKEDYAERISLGQIHEDVWAMESPRKKYIMLK